MQTPSPSLVTATTWCLCRNYIPPSWRLTRCPLAFLLPPRYTFSICPRSALILFPQAQEVRRLLFAIESVLSGYLDFTAGLSPTSKEPFLYDAVGFSASERTLPDRQHIYALPFFRQERGRCPRRREHHRHRQEVQLLVPGS